jgi:hypothetical protein
MRRQKTVWAATLVVLSGTVLVADKRPFRTLISIEPYDNVALPPGWDEKTEFVFARMMFPPHPFIGLFSGPRRARNWDWTEGGTGWTEDYPHFLMALKRLTLIHARSAEQPINLDDEDDVFYYPWLYVALPGSWQLTDSQVLKLREYLLRGGFLMADDFWGPEEWDNFEAGMRRVFPDRPIVELDNGEPIFHTLYDLDDRYQIPGMWAIRSTMSYRSNGAVAHWRGIHDEKGRLMVAVCFNSDTGDSWEFADDPTYPEKYSALGIRLTINFVLYAMTH